MSVYAAARMGLINHWGYYPPWRSPAGAVPTPGPCRTPQPPNTTRAPWPLLERSRAMAWCPEMPALGMEGLQTVWPMLGRSVFSAFVV